LCEDEDGQESSSEKSEREHASCREAHQSFVSCYILIIFPPNSWLYIQERKNGELIHVKGSGEEGVEDE
jgi:hypothetical protein